jgi:membrane-anchored protein YejM (alkaline phosphatase superfamily)
MRRPALLWALLHAPVFALLYGGSLSRALAGVPAGFRAPLWPSFALQAAGLSLLAWGLALPFSPWRRGYRFAAPLAVATLTVAVALDAQLHRALGFHVNGFFFKVLAQPGALAETGFSTREAALGGAAALLLVAADAAAGAWFLSRARPGRAWILAAALFLLAGAERLYTATLAFFGGPAVFAAGQVFPLQAPLRMNEWLGNLTGRPHTIMARPLTGAAAESAARLPAALPPGEVRFGARPDVVLALVESIPSSHLDADTMPRLWRRAEAGARFERHYAAASSTYYTVFGLLFGLQAHKLDAVVGAGRRPLLFAALRGNGYRMRLIAASSVDWMGLKDSTFGDVKADLDTEFPQGIEGEARDALMLQRARAFVEGAGDGPLFLFLFFDGTHFEYTFPPRSQRFLPIWDGAGALRSLTAPPALVRNRARNAAFEVDWKLDDFLVWMEARRGRAPLVVVTGDHGEEFGERGLRGHAHDVSEGETHVPMVIQGPGAPRGRVVDAPTSHVDIVPTLFRLLGDRNPPERYSDGIDAFGSPPDRFVLTTVGWEPRFAAVGEGLKVAFSGLDAGFGGALVTDEHDAPLPDGEARLSARAPALLRAFGRPGGRQTAGGAGPR